MLSYVCDHIHVVCDLINVVDDHIMLMGIT